MQDRAEEERGKGKRAEKGRIEAGTRDGRRDESKEARKESAQDPRAARASERGG